MNKQLSEQFVKSIREIAEVKAKIESNPKNAFMWIKLAGMYHRIKRINQALYAYKKAAELFPTDLTLNHIGDLYIQKGKLTRAELAYAQALNINPKNVYAMNRVEELDNGVHGAFESGLPALS
jgi:cytochrome c-type biogenesis protein CcmH/NrfG